MRHLILIVALVASAPAFAQSTSCGGQLQPRCEVNVASDAATDTAEATAKADIEAKNTAIKGTVDDIDPDKFKWTFIPEIPTAECVNPRLVSPLGQSVEVMDICGPFHTFQKFINGVLAFFCVIGCVRQVQAALAAK